jgi:hypothetical protein
VRDDRLAHVALQQTEQIEPVLDQHRTIEAVFLPQPFMERGVEAALPSHCFNRIAGDEADQNEDEQRDPDEGRNDQADPREQEAKHLSAASRLFDIDPIESVPAER